MTTVAVETTTRLMAKGFERYDCEDFLEGLGDRDADTLFGQLRDAFTELPPDPYAERAHRYRRYGRAVLVPWEQSLTWLPTHQDPVLGPVTEYYQGDHNPEHPGRRRRFPALSAATRANALLRQIILFDAREATQLEPLRQGLVHVGVHLLKLAVDGSEEEAVPSPNVLHQDGEPFTFAHLISRDNVTGGVNVIAPPRCAGLHPEEVSKELIQAEFTLDRPLDSYGVYDPQVSHYVSPVRRGSAARRGERSVLLVDFTPYVPHI